LGESSVRAGGVNHELQQAISKIGGNLLHSNTSHISNLTNGDGDSYDINTPPDASIPMSNTDMTAHPQIGFDAAFDFPIEGPVSHEQTQILLNLYFEMMHHFSFMAIPRSASVAFMMKDRPFLLLATISVAAFADTGLLHMSEKEFRNEVSRRLLIDGERSIDLLQGLLVKSCMVCYVHFRLW
jgi:hypothetical protein